jgi:hypothetical protein
MLAALQGSAAAAAAAASSLLPLPVLGRPLGITSNKIVCDNFSTVRSMGMCLVGSGMPAAVANRVVRQGNFDVQAVQQVQQLLLTEQGALLRPPPPVGYIAADAVGRM